MKATYTFEYDPTNVYERASIQHMLDGDKYRSILWDLDQYLRNKTKYGEQPKEAGETFEEVREKLLELCRDENVDLWSE